MTGAGLDWGARLAGHLPRVWTRLPRAGRTLYLTFDDGPSEATPDVLDVLDAHGAAASFFVLGSRLAPSLPEKLRAGPHAVGAHGWAHRDPWRRGDPGWPEADRAVEAALGQPPRWLRPPYGHLTPRLLRRAHRLDRHVALWDVMPGDFDPARPVAALVDHTRRRVRSGSIVVLHDGPEMAGRIEGLVEALVPRLVADGWLLAALPHDPYRLRPRGAQPGGIG